MLRHILHSLAIAKFVQFPVGATVLDVGTGGGFPGIPLAIVFPGSQFTLIDSIAKKIRVVHEVIEALGLENVKALQIKSTQLRDRFDYITGRAVTAFPGFFNSVKHLAINTKQKKGSILYLKGGDFDDEIKPFKNLKVYNISDIFSEPFFETKKLIHLKMI
jgi:16S rRNA (guanine527-N7)-methyltransferase